MMESVPAPALDGIGNIRSQEWLYNYLSSPDPQSILPSRLKAEYKMPSYAYLSDKDRHVLAQYLASLQVQDWYKEEAAKAEFEKLTGKEYKP
jgi:cbb3-type cytochrome oxidase cytochrome c subunit